MPLLLGRVSCQLPNMCPGKYLQSNLLAPEIKDHELFKTNKQPLESFDGCS